MKIDTKEDYDKAVVRANQLCDSEDDPWSNEEFCELMDAVEEYEDANLHLFKSLTSNAS